MPRPRIQSGSWDCAATLATVSAASQAAPASTAATAMRYTLPAHARTASTTDVAANPSRNVFSGDSRSRRRGSARVAMTLPMPIAASRLPYRSELPPNSRRTSTGSKVQ